MENIEDIVRQNVAFSQGSSAQGWNKVYCEVCGDGKRTKGPRGGWLFEDEMCFYHCFNCGIKGDFDPNREIPLSKDMGTIFKSFGIPASAYKEIVAKKQIGKKGSALNKPKKKKVKTPNLKVPKHFYKLTDADEENIIARKAIKFLRSKNVNPLDYTFYLSTGIGGS